MSNKEKLKNKSQMLSQMKNLILIMIIAFISIILFLIIFQSYLPGYFSVSLPFLIPGFLLFVMNLNSIKRGRLYQDIPTSKMRSVAMGLVEVKGDVEAIGEIFNDPIYNKPCVYYRIEILQRKGKGTSQIYFDENSESFFLSDDTGSVLIPGSLIPRLKASLWENNKNPKFDSHGATINKVKIKLVYYYTESIFSKKLPTPIKEFFDKHDIVYNKRQTCKVTFIEPGDRLYVIGTARPLNDSEIEHKSKAEAVIDDSYENRFIISDKSEKQLTEEALGLWWLYIMPSVLMILIGLLIAFAPQEWLMTKLKAITDLISINNF